MPLFLIIKLSEVSAKNVPNPPTWSLVAFLLSLLVLSLLGMYWLNRCLIKSNDEKLVIIRDSIKVGDENLELLRMHNSCLYCNWAASSCHLYNERKAKEIDLDKNLMQN